MTGDSRSCCATITYITSPWAHILKIMAFWCVAPERTERRCYVFVLLRKQSFARDCVDVCEPLYSSVCVGSTTFPLSQIISSSSAGIQASRNTSRDFGPSRSPWPRLTLTSFWRVFPYFYLIFASQDSEHPTLISWNSTEKSGFGEM